MPRPACPRCRSRRTAPILYGEPSFDPTDDVKRERLIIGGCLLGMGRVDGTDPARGCFACGHRFGVYDRQAFSRAIEAAAKRAHRRR